MWLLRKLKCAPFVLFLGLPGIVMAAPDPALAPASQPNLQLAAQPLTTERIDSLRKQAEESSELDEETKKTIAEIYRTAFAELQRSAALLTRATTYQTDADTVEQRVDKVDQKLIELKNQEPSQPTGETLADLEYVHSKLELQLAGRKKLQVAAESEPKTRAQRRKEIHGQLAALPDQLADMKQQVEALPTDEPALVTTARQIELAARRLALQRETPALENELAKYDTEAAADLVRLERDLYTQEVLLVEQQLELVEDQLKKLRELDAEKAVRKAREEAISADPMLASYAQRNRQLAEVGQWITEQFDAADRKLKAEKEFHEQLLRQFEQTFKKVESVGLTSSVGALLRKQRAELPDVRRRRTEA
ncbi:MAG: hypothetical protein N2C12_10950, partial [Planctomycetales bacterium]